MKKNKILQISLSRKQIHKNNYKLCKNKKNQNNYNNKQKIKNYNNNKNY